MYLAGKGTLFLECPYERSTYRLWKEWKEPPSCTQISSFIPKKKLLSGMSITVLKKWWNNSNHRQKPSDHVTSLVFFSDILIKNKSLDHINTSSVSFTSYITCHRSKNYQFCEQFSLKGVAVEMEWSGLII